MAELGPSVVSADLCGLRQEAVRIGKIGDHGNFGATVIAGVTGARDRA
jgi:hypothetical protein